MSIVTLSEVEVPIVRCGKPTRRGTCHIRLRGGMCFVHDLTDLAARNAKIAQQFREKNPEAFTQQRRAAGRAGYAKVGGVVWWTEQTEKARLWRLEHPSAHERTVMDALLHLLALDVHYDREVIFDDPRAVDFVLYRNRQAVAAIEVTESENRATFGRDDKLAAKVEWLKSLGLAVHIFYGSADLQTEFDRLGNFLREHGLAE